MKNITIGLSALLLISCGGETQQEEQAEVKTATCTFQYDETSTKVNWKAFKFTEKKGVGGTFNKVNVLISEASDDMFNTLTGATFTIPVNEINSENPDRDLKIQHHFFGPMTSTDIISGVVKSINNTTAVVEITMNGISKDYEGAVNVDGHKIGMTTTIDMVDFEAQVSVDSLNSVCNDLHKGEDGVSKLWSVVDISVETTLKQDCQ